MITQFRFKDRTITITSETIANAFLAALCARLVARGGWWFIIPSEKIELRPNGDPYRDRRSPNDVVRVLDFGDEYA